jgi:hypothetical protein
VAVWPPPAAAAVVFAASGGEKRELKNDCPESKKEAISRLKTKTGKGEGKGKGVTVAMLAGLGRKRSKKEGPLHDGQPAPRLIKDAKMKMSKRLEQDWHFYVGGAYGGGDWRASKIGRGYSQPLRDEAAAWWRFSPTR